MKRTLFSADLHDVRDGPILYLLFVALVPKRRVFGVPTHTKDVVVLVRHHVQTEQKQIKNSTKICK